MNSTVTNLPSPNKRRPARLEFVTVLYSALAGAKQGDRDMSENSESKPNLHGDRLRKHASDIENWLWSSVMTASAQASLRAAADEIERLEAAAVQQAEIARREQGNAIGHLNKIGNLRSEIERLEAANAKLAARQPDLAECLERVRELEASGKDLKAEIATLYAERQEIRGLFPESGEDNSLSLLECIRRRLARQSDLAEFLLDTPPASEVQCHT